MRKAELLAPAGSRIAAVAAINAGADAIYVGGKRFGARAFAENFSDSDLVDLIRFAHLRGVKVYATINTIVFDDEFPSLLAYADLLVANGIDAIIVQDLGVLDEFLHRYPDTPIHASTQMNVHTPEQAKRLADLGIARIILARETPIEVIRAIREATSVELEVFVHGALCVSYSGNCLFSAIATGRSGNRGECAQLCRLPYTLLRDGAPISDEAYLMSPKDLMTLERLGELVDLGVAAIKIEGRMRKPEYVAQAVSSYRKALSALEAGNPPLDLAAETDRLRRVFNRDFTEGHLFSVPPASIVNPYRPNHMGVEIGTVIGFDRGKASIRLSDALAVNDGIRFIGAVDSGNVVSRIVTNGRTVTRAFAGETVVLDTADPVDPGAKVMKTLDHDLETELLAYADENGKTIGIAGTVRAFVGEPLHLEISDVSGHVASETTPFAVARAENRPMSEHDLAAQMDRLGNTPFFFTKLTVHTDGKGFVPVGALNEIRRRVIEKLSGIRMSGQQGRRIVVTEPVAAGFSAKPFEIIVKVRSAEQLQAAADAGIRTIVHEETLAVDPHAFPGIRLIMQRSRIRQNEAEYADSISPYSSDLSVLGTAFRGDMFLNVANIGAINFLGRHGAESVTLSTELGQDRVKALVERYRERYGENPSLEIVAYGFQDLMISKYCPIARHFGANPGCSLCSLNDYRLKDRLGYEFPLLNDGHCNIRVLNSRALHLVDFTEFFRGLGISMRLDFTIETAAETKGVITAFQRACAKQSYAVDRQRSTYGRFIR
jgi:putative protease